MFTFSTKLESACFAGTPRRKYGKNRTNVSAKPNISEPPILLLAVVMGNAVKAELAKTKCEVTVRILYTDETLKHLFKAEEELRKAGVHFDVGSLVQENVREWSFDWSLEGAEVIFVRMKGDEKADLPGWFVGKSFTV